jgi:hypothetical protein
MIGWLLTTFLALSPQTGALTAPGFENATPLVTVTGRGAQVYTCTAGAWSAPVPVAVLFDTNGKQVGRHTVGPTWIWKDGSAINGSVIARQPAPDAATAIPWLLLSTQSDPTQSGFLAHVKWVRRTKTEGGVAPATACDAAHEAQTARVPYEATYTFYQ